VRVRQDAFLCPILSFVSELYCVIDNGTLNREHTIRSDMEPIQSNPIQSKY
jgi:hypothetical protein